MTDNLSHSDRDAYNLFLTGANAILRAADLSVTVERLEGDKAVDACHIATLTDANHGLETILAGLRADFSNACETIASLRAELDLTKADRAAQQTLAGKHWSGLQIMTTDRDYWRDSWRNTETARENAAIALSEANDKLGRFRDILGLPNPTPVAVVEPVPTPVPEPVAMVESTPAEVVTFSDDVNPEPIDLPNILHMPAPKEAPQESEPFPLHSGTSGWDAC